MFVGIVIPVVFPVVMRHYSAGVAAILLNSTVLAFKFGAAPLTKAVSATFHIHFSVVSGNVYHVFDT